MREHTAVPPVLSTCAFKPKARGSEYIRNDGPLYLATVNFQLKRVEVFLYFAAICLGIQQYHPTILVYGTRLRTPLVLCTNHQSSPAQHGP